MVDRQVEARVHRGEHDGEPGDRRPGLAVGAAERAPGTSPQGEDRGRADDAEPGDAQRVDPGEEENGERGSEIVEDRAHDEERVGRGGEGTACERTAQIQRRRGERHLDMVAADLR
jgi:hypothetical protein